MKMTKMAWEKRYSDDSGVEFAIRFNGHKNEIEIEHIDNIRFPIDQIDWVIDCLNKIKAEQEKSPN